MAASAPISLTRPEAYFQLAVDFRTICGREAVDGRLVLAALLPLALVAPQVAFPVARPREGEKDLALGTGELLRRQRHAYSLLSSASACLDSPLPLRPRLQLRICREATSLERTPHRFTALQRACTSDGSSGREQGSSTPSSGPRVHDAFGHGTLAGTGICNPTDPGIVAPCRPDSLALIQPRPPHRGHSLSRNP